MSGREPAATTRNGRAALVALPHPPPKAHRIVRRQPSGGHGRQAAGCQGWQCRGSRAESRAEPRAAPRDLEIARPAAPWDLAYGAARATTSSPSSSTNPNRSPSPSPSPSPNPSPSRDLDGAHYNLPLNVAPTLAYILQSAPPRSSVPPSHRHRSSTQRRRSNRSSRTRSRTRSRAALRPRRCPRYSRLRRRRSLPPPPPQLPLLASEALPSALARGWTTPGPAQGLSQSTVATVATAAAAVATAATTTTAAMATEAMGAASRRRCPSLSARRRAYPSAAIPHGSVLNPSPTPSSH